MIMCSFLWLSWELNRKYVSTQEHIHGKNEPQEASIPGGKSQEEEECEKTLSLLVPLTWVPGMVSGKW